MIAKEYISIINDYFQSKFNRKEVIFLDKESAKPSEIKFGDRKVYTIEIWMLNYNTRAKEKVFTVVETVLYNNNEMKEVFKYQLLKKLWVLTMRHIDEIDKYGI